MNKLKDLKQRLQDIKLTYNYEEEYNNIYNLVVDYMNETQDFDLEYSFEDFIDYDTAEEITKHELETGGLEGLQFRLGGKIMAKLGKQMYYSKNGEAKINCYKINISKEIVKNSGIKDTDNIKIYSKINQIIIEKV